MCGLWQLRTVQSMTHRHRRQVVVTDWYPPARRPFTTKGLAWLLSPLVSFVVHASPVASAYSPAGSRKARSGGEMWRWRWCRQ